MQTMEIEAVWPTLDASAKTALVDADVVIGIDRETGDEYTLYGLPGLESSASLRRPSAMRVVQISFDHGSQPFDALVQLIRKLKARET